MGRDRLGTLDGDVDRPCSGRGPSLSSIAERWLAELCDDYNRSVNRFGVTSVDEADADSGVVLPHRASVRARIKARAADRVVLAHVDRLWEGIANIDDVL